MQEQREDRRAAPQRSLAALAALALHQNHRTEPKTRNLWMGGGAKKVASFELLCAFDRVAALLFVFRSVRC